MMNFSPAQPIKRPWFFIFNGRHIILYISIWLVSLNLLMKPTNHTRVDFSYKKIN